MKSALSLLAIFSRLAGGWGQNPALRLHDILSTIEDEIQKRRRVEALIEVLEVSKKAIFDCFCKQFESIVVSKALTLKLLNLCLAKYHFLSRNTTLLSRPFGLIVDPSNVCNLACPGCVHSAHAQELKLFEWDKGMAPENRMAAFFKYYGPYSINTTFYNYGEPLVNPNTPRFIRLAKAYLLRTTISTSLSLARVDAEAYVESGLDSMGVSIDGATQSVYEKFRRNGNLALVHSNVRKIVEAKHRLGRRAPIVTWRYLAFEHNAHQIPLAIDQARDLGVDQFMVCTPFDVSWDEPGIRPAAIEEVTLDFGSDLQATLIENWNPFPGELDASTIEHEFELGWVERAVRLTQDAGEPAASCGSTCHWLYKSITMDAGGRMFPCCASPRPDADLVFSKFDGGAAFGLFNSEKYRLSRLHFSDPAAYQLERDALCFDRDPYCVTCEWDKTAPNADSTQIQDYFNSLPAGAGKLFNSRSLEILSSW